MSAPSNFAAWHIAKANESARRRHFLGLVSEQSLYNLDARTVEMELFPALQDYGLGLICYSPLGEGFLGGALNKINKGRRAETQVIEKIGKNRAKLEAWEGLCWDLGGRSPANTRSLGRGTSRRVTAPIIWPAHDQRAPTAAFAPSKSSFRRKRLRNSTRTSSPATRPRRSITPGEPTEHGDKPSSATSVKARGFAGNRGTASAVEKAGRSAGKTWTRKS